MRNKLILEILKFGVEKEIFIYLEIKYILSTYPIRHRVRIPMGNVTKRQ